MVSPFTIDPYLSVNARNRGAAEARAEAVTQSTIAAQSISNDINRFNLARRMDEERKVGIQDRSNRAILAQKKGIINQRDLDFVKSDAAGLYHTKLLHQAMNLKIGKNAVEMAKTEGNMQKQELINATDFATTKMQNIHTTQKLQDAEDDAKYSGMLNRAIGADRELRASGEVGTAVVDLANSMATSNPDAFARLYSQFDGPLDNANRRGELPLAAREGIRDARNIARYTSATRGVSSGVSRMVQDVNNGQAAPVTQSFLSAVGSVGLVATNPESVQKVDIERSDEGYTVVNSLSGQRSRLIDSKEFEANADMMKLYHNVVDKNDSSFNPINNNKKIQETLEQMAKHPMGEKIQMSFNNAVETLKGKVADVDKFAVDAQRIMTAHGNDLVEFNPVFTAEGEAMVDASSEGALGFAEDVLISALTLGSGTRSWDVVHKHYEKNPNKVVDLMAAYTNRATGGLPRSVYNGTVNEFMRAIKHKNPNYSDANKSDAEIRDRDAKLRRDIQTAVAVPVDFGGIKSIIGKLETSGFFDTEAGERILRENPDIVRDYINAGDDQPKTMRNLSDPRNIYNHVKGRLVGNTRNEMVGLQVPDVQITKE